VDAYPDAKFIYTRQPVEKWYGSDAPMISDMFAVLITLMRFVFEPSLSYRCVTMSQKSYQVSMTPRIRKVFWEIQDGDVKNIGKR